MIKTGFCKPFGYQVSSSFKDSRLVLPMDWVFWTGSSGRWSQADMHLRQLHSLEGGDAWTSSSLGKSCGVEPPAADRLFGYEL